MRTPNLGKLHKRRLHSLLYMEYKPSELAEELHIDVNTIYRSYIPAGCPHRVDSSGRFWIVGTEFAEWVRETFKKKTVELQPDEGYCFSCKAVVKMSPPFSYKRVNDYVTMQAATCSVCGRKVNRTKASKK